MSPGRPKLPPDQKRVIRKGIAFSKAEYDQLCRLAFCLRVSSVNELIRLMVLPEPKPARNFGCLVNPPQS